MKKHILKTRKILLRLNKNRESIINTIFHMSNRGYNTEELCSRIIAKKKKEIKRRRR